MNENTTSIELGEPGAGLPGLERLLLSAGLKLYARFSSNERLLAQFLHEADRLLELASSVTEAQGQRPVLIDRFPGIEDSSRNWSVYMVLQHLITVNRGVAGVIRALCRGETPAMEVRIQDVKPGLDAGQEQIEKFERTASTYASLVRAKKDLHTRLRHPHPWFGPLNAHQWHCLAAIHNGLHRRQLQRILAALSSAGAVPHK